MSDLLLMGGSSGLPGEIVDVSGKIKEFNGKRYYRNKAGYFCVQTRRGSDLLHRSVWEYHNGPIPEGHVVHHIDGDRANNNIENLTLVTFQEHAGIHMKNEENIAHLDEIRVSRWADAPCKEYVCETCGATFSSRASGRYKDTPPRFCSKHCCNKVYTPIYAQRRRERLACQTSC